MSPGSFMVGAQDRLLPPSLPFRFFVTALIMQGAAWSLLLVGADGLVGFTGGLGPVVAALHLVTLGVLAMTALGAAFQLLPVATSRALGPLWACRLTWWLFTPGVAELAGGLATGWEPALHGGATLAVAGLALGGFLLARTLMGVSGLAGIVRHVWVALASLVGLAVLGVALVVDFGTGLLPDHQAVAAAHAVLATYGFMGNLGFAFATVLVPMFVLGRAVPEAIGKVGSALAALALMVTVAGLLAGWGWLAALGGVVGVVTIVWHLKGLMAVVKSRMRKRLEPFFRLVVPALVLLPVSVVAGIALALGARPDVMAPLWGVLLVFGWLLSFVTGILQRIMPFLASMHSAASGGKPALLSRLTAQRPLDGHAVLHGLAVLLMAAGIVVRVPLLVRVGAGCGLAGAVALIAFTLALAGRYRAHRIAFPLTLE